MEEDGIWRELKAEEGKLSISSSIILVQNNYKPVVLVALQYLCLESRIFTQPCCHVRYDMYHMW